ncbi:Mortality factor 4-like protein 1 [Sciurus carolinensis]|nr:Mortality factor 4-like protein 1 [Sciurus carolinensis]
MSEKKQPVDLGLLEEDDEFEEFPAEDWAGLDEDEDAHVWEDNWDDDNVEDDFSNQLRQEQLFYLPAKKNVDSILKDYANYKKFRGNTDNKEYAVNEVVAGIKECFNIMLGTQLLYKFERPQYAEIFANHPYAPMSQVYGSPHLLRIFVQIGAMLAYTPLDEKSLALLLNYLHDFFNLVKNSATLFSVRGYEVTPPEYHQKAV